MERLMTITIKELKTPLSLETVRNLKIGDMVCLTGSFFSCRSKFHAKVVRERVPIPRSLRGVNVMCHMGPIMKKEKGEWVVVSAGPTTSFRMDSYAPAMIKQLGLRAIIGKGTMGEKTMAAMRNEGCVHLCSVGMDANALPSRIERVLSVHYLEEFGMIEAVWVFEAKKWGPFIVDIDTTGANYFRRVDKEARKRLPNILKRLGVDPRYEYSTF
jgi:tartrate/fumarate subfamily iron-sulfur-dependent hydro-lyase beta chain